MNSSLLPSPNLLCEAAQAGSQGTRPLEVKLSTALLLAEQSARNTRLEIAPAAIYGAWRLCFIAPSKPRLKDGKSTRRGFYLPSWVHGVLCIEPPNEGKLPVIHNQLKIGPLEIRFSGQGQWLGKRNLFAFEFTFLDARLGMFPLYRGNISSAPQLPMETMGRRLPFFSFFAASEAYIAARGQSGGIALWTKRPG